MYSYTYDTQTGGLLLNSSPSGFSKEPRPVYAHELNLLGFDKYWCYENQDECPYMWAEANAYYYRGICVAKLKGGDLFTAPEIILSVDINRKPIEPEPKGGKLRPIDIEGMVKANQAILNIIEETTVKKIVAIYEKYKDRLDLFHVAFSGGKDSIVLLDLVKKALPKNSFLVVFGDTGMEFPDTYQLIKKIETQCKEEDVLFYQAKSHFEPEQSWDLFGPPSRVLRWCCSVHKSTPQTLKLREVIKKNDYTGLDFVGVRAHESVARSEYEYENYGKKQKGQYSHNSILEWTSAEVWLYIYAHNLIINNAYKKGNSRAGCILCPMSGGLSDFMRRSNYKEQVDKYVDCIKKLNAMDKQEKKSMDSYIINGGWNARNNGRDLVCNVSHYTENIKQGNLELDVISPRSDWKEWIKTLGELSGDEKGNYVVVCRHEKISFSLLPISLGYRVILSAHYLKSNPTLGKIFKQVFRKASYCNGCAVCEVNCKKGCIHFHHQKIKISNCVQCFECHAIDGGCFAYHSLRLPQGGGTTMKKSLNSFADHAPKPEWLGSFFELKKEFFTEHTLGPMMYANFKRFLRDAGLIDKNQTTPFTELIDAIGWDTDTAQGLMLLNLVNENPQIEWYIKNLEIGNMYERSSVEEMLTALDVKLKDAKSIVKSYKRIVETPFGTKLNFGYVTKEGALVRTKCMISDVRVVLYGLYKFAEKCGDHKEFTLGTLMNDNIERNGLSPTQVLGIDREEMKQMLLGLSAKYPELIEASFTHDLEKIALMNDKISCDVLKLFEGEKK